MAVVEQKVEIAKAELSLLSSDNVNGLFVASLEAKSHFTARTIQNSP